MPKSGWRRSIIVSSRARKKSVAGDGGLYVPDCFENIYGKCMKAKSYSDLCSTILSSFFPEIDISDDVESAYMKFSTNPPLCIKSRGPSCNGAIPWTDLRLHVPEKAKQISMVWKLKMGFIPKRF